jgi:hypothetical protein
MKSNIVFSKNKASITFSQEFFNTRVTNMCKHIRLHLALEFRAPECRNRQMEIFKCDVNFKDIWKIVVRIRTN